MNIRCLLVDDEPPALRVLQRHITNLPGLDIVGTCKNAIEAMNLIHEKQVDLLFLDIKMPRLLGTDFLRGLQDPPKVIFVSAYRDFAVESYDLDAVDYLLKPVTFERFVSAVSRARAVLDKKMPAVVKTYHSNPDAFVYVKVNRSMQKILLDHIFYLESWKDYVKIFLTGNRVLLAKQPIGAMENLLSEHRFLRVHRSYIVSLIKISSYSHNAVRINQFQIPIGRLYKRQVLETLNSPRG